MPDKVSTLIADLVSSMSNISLYSKEHAAVMYFCERAVRNMTGLFKDGSISLTLLGDSLHMNDVRVQEQGLHVAGFARRLKGRGIEKIVFREGMDAKELMQFLSDIVTKEDTPSVSQNISLGIMEVRLKGRGGGGFKKVIDENMPRLDEIYQGVRKHKKLDLVGLEDVVSSYLTTIRSEMNVIGAVGAIRHHSEYTFAHTTNVSILSMYLAQAVGIKGELLREVGLAGLLHDIGKSFIPVEIIEKEGKLEKDEWVEIKKHPVYGAKYLSSMSEVPRVAVIGAYEHHLKFDGSGYPEPLRRTKKQHVISQIIAISDFFDALRTQRSYRKALDVPVILGLMKEASGKDFNPVLVKSFLVATKGVFKD